MSALTTRGPEQQAQRGFTLLEVLVATAILGTAVTALFGLLSGALGNTQRLQAPAQALLLGQSCMNELLVAGVAGLGKTAIAMPLDQTIQGSWNEQFRWQALATRFNPPPQLAPGQPVLVRIALDVFWKSGPSKQEKKLSLESYQLQIEQTPTGR